MACRLWQNQQMNFYLQFNHYCCRKGHFPLDGIFRAEQHFLLFKDQLADSGCQKTKEHIIPRGKFRPVENDPKTAVCIGDQLPYFSVPGLVRSQSTFSTDSSIEGGGGGGGGGYQLNFSML